MESVYLNRHAAGQALAKHLSAYRGDNNTLILALPRGGVPVAYEVAIALHLPLDIFVVRKLGVPGDPELAMGALASQGEPIFNEEMIHSSRISSDAIKAVIEKEKKEIKRRENTYREGKPLLNVLSKTVILIDDGIATGATMRAAIDALRKLKASKIVVAVPVADQSIVPVFSSLADEFICPLQPTHLQAVGQWYEHFDQTEDEEVHTLLRKWHALIGQNDVK